MLVEYDYIKVARYHIIDYLLMYAQSHTLPQHKSNLCKIL